MKRWPTRPLGEVAQVTAGDPAPQRAEDFSDDGIPFVRMQDVGRFGHTTCLSETKDRLAASVSPKFKRFPAGSILVPKSGASIRLNHRAILGVEAHVVSHLAIVVPSSSLDSRFTYYWLCGTDLAGVAHQADLPSMKTSDLAKLQLPIPPLAEQERIVKLLDEADELRNLRAQADRRTATLLPSLFNEFFGGSSKWPIVSVEEAGRVQLGRQRAPKYQTGKFTRPYVRVANVHEDEIDISDLLSMDFDERDFKQYRLEHGDVLLNEGQSKELVGRPAMWRNEVLDCCFQNTLIRFQPDRKRVLPDFALALFLSYYRAGEFAKISSQTSNVAHLGAGRFAKMPFVLPPVALQKEFAHRVAEIRELEASQAASRFRLEVLFQSMLHRAYTGELTAGAEVVELRSSPEFIRAVLAAEIADRMHGHKPFGRVMLQKIIYLAEYHAQLAEIDSEPRRFAAGPHDPDLIKQVEAKMKAQEWYEAVPRSGDSDGFKYHALAKAGGHRQHFEILWPKVAPGIRKLIDEMKTWKTERCERFATVYAAWNDLILWGAAVTDDAILDQVLKHWHSDKLKIAKPLWQETLTWMKREGYIPTGFGRPTTTKPQPELFG